MFPFAPPDLDDPRRKRGTVAIDFDGVIHSYEKGWGDGSIYGTEVPGAFGAIWFLMELFNVFIFTSRDPVEVAEWLGRMGGFNCRVDLPAAKAGRKFWSDPDWLLITDLKLPAIAYIDDRGIRFTDWRDALSQLGQIAGPEVMKQAGPAAERAKNRALAASDQKDEAQS